MIIDQAHGIVANVLPDIRTGMIVGDRDTGTWRLSLSDKLTIHRIRRLKFLGASLLRLTDWTVN
jgi:hypothetical protein